MKLLSLIEKFVDQTPEVDGEQATARPFPQPQKRMKNSEVYQNREVLVAYMADRGWEKIGDGHFSTVFESDKVPGMVLKIMPERDRGYMKFYSLAKRSDNPHYPHVSKLGVMRVPNPVYAVLVEKLEQKPFAMVAGLHEQIDLFMDEKIEHLPEFITKKYPEFEQALIGVKSLTGTKAKYVGDLHHANLRWRGNIPVIIDPLASWQEVR